MPESAPEVHVAMPTQLSTAEPDENWAICCSNSSAHFIKYIVQVVISMTILAFAIAMIATGHDDAVYWSLITLIVGVFVPQPSLGKGKI